MTTTTYSWLIICALLSGTTSAQMQWPQDGRIAISLNYDDALHSQLDHALPALNQYGFKASFYLTLSSPVISKRLPDWRNLAIQGHELGNHTLFHHCRGSLPNREWVQPHQDLDQRNPAQLLEEVVTANAFLTAIDGELQRTFTPPCGDSKAGGEDYINLVAKHFLAIKGQEPSALNAVWLAPVDKTGKELIALIEQHGQKSRLINLTFHGIGGDYLSVSDAAHRSLLKFLAAHPDRYYVAPYRHLAAAFNIFDPNVPAQ